MHVRLVTLIFITSLLAVIPYSHSLRAEDTSVINDANAYYELALSAWHNRKENESFIYVKNALQVNPSHVPSLILLSELFFSAGNFPAARTTSEKALALGADINLILPVLGQTYLQLKDFGAIDHLERYADRLSRQGQFEWALIRAQRSVLGGNEEQAIDIFGRAHQMFPDDIRAMNALAEAYLRADLFDRADQLIQRSLKKQPDNERTWVLLGEFREKKGQLNAAIDAWLKAFEIDSEDPKLLRLLAGAYVRLKAYDEAEKFLMMILDQYPFDPTANLMEAGLLLERGHGEEAKEKLASLSQRLSQLEKTELLSQSDLLLVRAISEDINGNKESARSLLEDYLSAQPDDIAAIRMLVRLYNQNGEFYKSLSLLERKLPTVARDLDLSLRLATIYLDQRKFLKSEELIRKIKSNFGESAVIVFLEARQQRLRGHLAEALSILRNHTYHTHIPLPNLLEEGRLLLALGRFDEAERLSQRLMRTFPDDNEVQALRASLSLEQGQYEQALTVLDRLYSLNPENNEIRYNRAVALTRLGRSAEAEKALKAIVESRTDFLPAMMLLSRLALGRGDYQVAHDWVNQVLSSAPNDQAALFLKYQIYLGERKYSEALATIRALHFRDRLNEQFTYEYANNLIRMGQFSDARPILELLFSMRSSNKQGLVRLAELQRAAGDFQGAQKSLERALALKGKNTGLYMEAALLALAEGRFEQVEKWAQKYRKAGGEPFEYFSLVAQSAGKQGDKERAFDVWSKAITLNHPGVRRGLAELYELSKEGVGVARFNEIMEGWLRKNPSDLWAKKLAADAFLLQGNYEKSAGLYETLLATDTLKDDLALVNNLANAYAQLDPAKALAFIEPYIDQASGHFALLDTAGWLYVQNGAFEKGLALLRNAYALNAASGEVRYHLGKALMGLGRTDEARREFEAAIRAGESFPGADDARVLLQKYQGTSEKQAGPVSRALK